eukprot:CAMPEP_0181102626 /NCGR_PEP_ID=MMETSP1071-20121207/14420_1 /TAXON_ID=35127 /ORGANISM="Thalassiosira sp., Strain NH16" /LENGTH=1128 /DNA_ID=CAMNT_0023185621 /DNA_START=90 /DNA_END=3477 /DNA_ORIENTATION=+
MAVKFVQPDDAAENEVEFPASSSPEDSIADIVYSHFDAYQRDRASSSSSSSATRAAASMRRDLLSAEESSSSSAAHEATARAIVRCIDSAMAIVASSSSSRKDWNESVASTLELAAAFACHGYGKKKEDDRGCGTVVGFAARAVIQRAAEYGVAEKDAIRAEACGLLGSCARHLVEGNRPAASILKKKKKGVATTTTTGTGAAREVISGWRAECLLSVATALLPRITDKIARVRNAAVSACAHLFAHGDAANASGVLRASDEFAMVDASVRNALLWIAANDSSAGNRALVARILPTVPAAGSDDDDDGEEDDDDDENVRCIIERIKDVDCKVREAALDALRTRVDFEEQLTEDQRVEILRNGLTKRCATTYAKTVELLCTNWLKSTRFDPIALLDRLNPVLNEAVCERASRVLLRVASTIDCETDADEGVALVRKHLGGPEIRELRCTVLKKRSIVPPPIPARGGTDEDDAGEDETQKGIGGSSAPALGTSTALFLRVQCDISANKSDTITDIVSDIPTLCNLLNGHIDRLIEFNNDEDYDEVDEDEAAAFEDDQNFLCLQLIHMAKSSELREEGSRRHFITIMRRILSRLATPDDLVEACVKAMATAHDKESQFLQTVSEILVDVEDDDTFRCPSGHDEKAIVIVRQMRIIAILSIVLESISGRMTGHPILDGFFLHLSPAITSKNAIVREHGVICLSKFCLLSGEEKVVDDFKPLLMTVAGSVEERVEVRAQAALALCDLALIHERMLLGPASDEDDQNEEGGPSIPFKDMLLEMMGHAKPGIVIIAAEIAAKLLLAGRLRDPNLIAWLLVIYFDTSLTADFEADEGAEVAKEVGSPVRLQQLLSIFFPTYSMSSLDANDDMMASVAPLISIVNDKLSGMRKDYVKEALAQRWPIGKMVEYVCYTVDLADKKKNDQGAVAAVSATDEAASNIGEQAMEQSDNDDAEKADSDQALLDENKQEKEVVVEASSTLLASIDVAEFLSEEGADSAPTLYARALAKILASACIDIDAEDRALLRRLKLCVGEAEYANDDGPTVKSIKKLDDLLVDVEDDCDEEEKSVVSEIECEQNEDDHKKEKAVAKEHVVSEEEIDNIVEKETLDRALAALSHRQSKVVQREKIGDYRIV